MSNVRLTPSDNNNAFLKKQNLSFSGGQIGSNYSPLKRVFKTTVREALKVTPGAVVYHVTGNPETAIASTYLSKVIFDTLGQFRSNYGTTRYVSDLNFVKLGIETTAAFKKLTKNIKKVIDIPATVKKLPEKIKEVVEKISNIF